MIIVVFWNSGAGGASPIGDGVNAALAVLGGWAADRITEL
jgi:hypothetical protein